MNRSRLNGTVLGNGGNDARSFVYISLLITTTLTDVGVYVKRYVSSAVTASATFAPGFSAVYQLAGSVAARATLAIGTLGTYYAKYVSASFTATASWLAASSVTRYVSGLSSAGAVLTEGFIKGTTWASSITASAAFTANAWRGRVAEAAQTCSATLTELFVTATKIAGSTNPNATFVAAYYVTGFPASAERTMTVPAEDRSMKVT